jgi:hypothetical protein
MASDNRLSEADREKVSELANFYGSLVERLSTLNRELEEALRSNDGRNWTPGRPGLQDAFEGLRSKLTDLGKAQNDWLDRIGGSKNLYPSRVLARSVGFDGDKILSNPLDPLVRKARDAIATFWRQSRQIGAEIERRIADGVLVTVKNDCLASGAGVDGREFDSALAGTILNNPGMVNLWLDPGVADNVSLPSDCHLRSLTVIRPDQVLLFTRAVIDEINGGVLRPSPGAGQTEAELRVRKGCVNGLWLDEIPTRLVVDGELAVKRGSIPKADGAGTLTIGWPWKGARPIENIGPGLLVQVLEGTDDGMITSISKHKRGSETEIYYVAGARNVKREQLPAVDEQLAVFTAEGNRKLVLTPFQVVYKSGSEEFVSGVEIFLKGASDVLDGLGPDLHFRTNNQAWVRTQDLRNLLSECADPGYGIELIRSGKVVGWVAGEALLKWFDEGNISSWLNPKPALDSGVRRQARAVHQ